MDLIKRVKNRIEEILTIRENDIKNINTKKDEIAAAIEEQKQIMEKASAAFDIKAYSEAKIKTEILGTQGEMYDKRLEQLIKKELVSEAESEKTIADLLRYETELENTFSDNVLKLIYQIKKLCDEHAANAREAETVLQLWTSKVRPNYISPGTVFANGTNKSDRPVKIHPAGYSGGDALDHIRQQIVFPFEAKITEFENEH